MAFCIVCLEVHLVIWDVCPLSNVVRFHQEWAANGEWADSKSPVLERICNHTYFLKFSLAAITFLVAFSDKCDWQLYCVRRKLLFALRLLFAPPI